MCEYTYFQLNALIEALIGSDKPLEELTIKDLKADISGKTRPHKGTKDRSGPVASRLKEITPDGVMKWHSTAVTTEGKDHWDQTVRLLDWDEALSFEDLKYNERANLALSGDIECSCSCPAFLFWGYQYMATQLDYNSGDAENRFPIIRNPNLETGLCKHLVNVVNAAMFHISEVAAAMKKVRGESTMQDKDIERLISEAIKSESIRGTNYTCS